MIVLVVADPLEGLDPAVDASVGLMVSAQAVGAEVWSCTPEGLAFVDGRVRATATRLTLRGRRRSGDHRWLVQVPWWEAQEHAVLDVAAVVDLVLLRIDPPVDARYLHTTYLLDLVVDAGVRVVNRPEGVRALHEKLVALRLPGLCPPTVVSAEPATVRAFVAEVGVAVLKPVDGFAGADVWLVRDDSGATALVESATCGGTRHVIAQAYLPQVDAGNKRLFLVDGDVVGAVLRRPCADDFRIGAPVAAAEVDADDRRIAAALAPLLAGHGLVLAGVDVIDGRLIEVNVTCPGGMSKTDALLGTDLSGEVLRRLLPVERHLA